MSGHTPGPWSTCGASNGKCECRMIWAPSGDAVLATAAFRGVVACVHQEWGDGPDMVYGSVDPEQTLANALLIAAAPLDKVRALVQAEEGRQP